MIHHQNAKPSENSSAFRKPSTSKPATTLAFAEQDTEYPLGNRALQRFFANARPLKPMNCMNGGISRQIADEDVNETLDIEPVEAVAGEGQPHEAVAFANGRKVSLRGKTQAHFNGGSFQTQNVVTAPGQGCRQCGRRDCVHVTGDLSVDYQVTTTVTLPRMPPGLTTCQQERVQQSIDTVLSPHEQEHVQAFEQYNGATQRPFDLTICRRQFPQMIQKMVRDEERERRKSAQAASDALDPFNFDVDLDCEDW